MVECRFCTKCGVNKEENEVNFRQCKYKSGTAYFKSFCRDCEKQSNLNFARTHKEKRKEYQQRYSLNNPEYIKRWKIDNKDKINKRERLRHTTDINFKLKKNVSRAIGHAIHKNGHSVINYLPYTIDDLKCHLESQFNENMTWDNYGIYWHIDHIVPHSDFKYSSMNDEEFEKCWALSNLRPLEAQQNMLDGATRIRHKK